MKIGIAGALGLVAASAGGQAIDFGSFAAFGPEMPFGMGNQNLNYIISRNAGEGIEIGIKAKERLVGQLPTDGTNRYFSPTGSPDNDGLAVWNIDFGFAFENGTIDQYDVELRLDFDPAANSASFTRITLSNSPDLLGLASGGGSQNPGFAFWGVDLPGLVDASGYQVFDADAVGEYEFGITVRDSAGSVLADATGFVVVPAPGGAALLGLGGLLAVRRRR